VACAKQGWVRRGGHPLLSSPVLWCIVRPRCFSGLDFLFVLKWPRTGPRISPRGVANPFLRGMLKMQRTNVFSDPRGQCGADLIFIKSGP
jgi:hypothetical protein